jgi:hypothetical protein
MLPPIHLSAVAGCALIVGKGLTIISWWFEFVEGQTPFFTTALKRVVAVKLPGISVDVTFEMVFQVLKGLTALSQLVTPPVSPLNVNVPGDVPVQIGVLPPLTEPPTDAGVIVTVVANELSEAQVPFFTTALN